MSIVNNLLLPADKPCIVTSDASITYRELYDRACHMAHQLRHYRRRPVLLIYHPDDCIGFAVAFYACLIAGAIAVPTPPTKTYRKIQRDCQAAAIVTTWTLYVTLFDCCCTTTFIVEYPFQCFSLNPREHDPEDIAFLQYTSGSTSSPRGVVVSHRALEANVNWVVNDYLGDTTDLVSVTWVPFFHDYGLTAILNCHAVGGTFHYISPMRFMKDPLHWLRMMTLVKSTHTQAPNFAFGLCARHARLFPHKASGIDLSSVRQFSMGGEMIRESTMRAFRDAFSVQDHQMDPSYGMAEMVCGIVHCQGSERKKSSMHGVVNVGKIGPNVEVKIMEDGEVWVRGDAMMSGYYLRPDDEAFGNADGKRWVMTGDLGFVHDGCLYIKGRKKDVIILNGRNIVSTDVEWVLQENFPELRPGNIAAVPFYENEEEKLGIVAELRDHLVAPSRKAMRRAMYEAMEVPLHRILFVKKRTLPKTSSGKLQRYKCREYFE